MYMYVCMCVYIYIYIYTHTHISMYTYAYTRRRAAWLAIVAGAGATPPLVDALIQDNKLKSIHHNYHGIN